MKKRTIFYLIPFCLFLFACTSPTQTVEPNAGVSTGQEAAVEQVDEPTPYVPREYPSPEVAAEESNQTQGYPEPEIAAKENGYPEPEQAVELDKASADTAAMTDGSDDAEEAAEKSAEIGEGDEDEAASGPESKEVLIAAADELNLHATYNTNGAAEPQPAVLLLHMLNGNRKVWDESGFSSYLNENGYITLALDMRGHGESLAQVDWVQAEDDLNQVWEWLIAQPEVDAANSFVIGGSIGGNMALVTAGNQPSVKGAVLLSPGLNYRDVTTDDVIAEMDRPVLMFAMTADSYSANSVVQMEYLNAEFATASVVEGSAHGTNMLGVFEGIEAEILAFLNSNIN